MFHARAAAAGNERSPRVERRVGGTSKVDVSADRRRCRVDATASDWMSGLGKVVGCGTVEATVRQHTQPELDSLRHLEPVQRIVCQHGIRPCLIVTTPGTLTY